MDAVLNLIRFEGSGFTPSDYWTIIVFFASMFLLSYIGMSYYRYKYNQLKGGMNYEQ